MLPLTVRRRVSVRVRNFETNHLKVNDADGNPVEIAAIVVWQVADTAKATYAVDDYAGLRLGAGRVGAAARRHQLTPTTTPPATGTSLRGRPTSWSASSPTRSPSASPSPASRSSRCGSPTSPTRPEIAQAMLRRQQANAVVAARSRIVEGAVGMVELALEPARPRTAWSSSTRNARPAWSAT